MTPKETRIDTPTKARELDNFKKSENALKETIEKYQAQVYTICLFFLPQDEAEEIVIDIFYEFAYEFKRQQYRFSKFSSDSQIKIFLFKKCWDALQSEMIRGTFPMSFGRDTRPLQAFEADSADISQNYIALKERLSLIDPDLRIAVLLKDLLKFDDEEISQILGLRWGVYRHRLHRARLDLVASLKGNLFQWN